MWEFIYLSTHGSWGQMRVVAKLLQRAAARPDGSGGPRGVVVPCRMHPACTNVVLSAPSPATREGAVNATRRRSACTHKSMNTHCLL